jgi:uncharacterized protein (DUF427 family)
VASHPCAEDEEVLGHPRDPFHRVDVRASSRHVQLVLDGELLADTPRPPRTWCPYKGAASYWSVAVGDRVVPDLVRGCPAPLADAEELGGCRAFFDERLDVVVDGVPQQRPITPSS